MFGKPFRYVEFRSKMQFCAHRVQLRIQSLQPLLEDSSCLWRHPRLMNISIKLKSDPLGGHLGAFARALSDCSDR